MVKVIMDKKYKVDMCDINFENGRSVNLRGNWLEILSDKSRTLAVFNREKIVGAEVIKMETK